MPNIPLRTEVWMTDFGVGLGREQAGMRPSLVISDDGFNQSAADLVIVIPITSRAKGVRTHVPIIPPEGGLTMASYVKCEDVRSISKDRLTRKMGAAGAGYYVEGRGDIACVAQPLVFDLSVIAPRFIHIKPVH